MGLLYSQVFTTTGGTEPHICSVLTGSTGELNLTGGGTLTGTPTAPASLSFTVQVRDAPGNVGTASYTLEIGQQ